MSLCISALKIFSKRIIKSEVMSELNKNYFMLKGVYLVNFMLPWLCFTTHLFHAFGIPNVVQCDRVVAQS